MGTGCLHNQGDDYCGIGTLLPQNGNTNLTRGLTSRCDAASMLGLATCQRTTRDCRRLRNLRERASYLPLERSRGHSKCLSCLIFVAFAMVAFNSAMLFVAASRLSSVAPNCWSEVRNGTLAPLHVSRHRLLLAFDPVETVLAARVLGDELGSNLLEFCTTLLVNSPPVRPLH